MGDTKPIEWRHGLTLLGAALGKASWKTKLIGAVVIVWMMAIPEAAPIGILALTYMGYRLAKTLPIAEQNQVATLGAGVVVAGIAGGLIWLVASTDAPTSARPDARPGARTAIAIDEGVAITLCQNFIEANVNYPKTVDMDWSAMKWLNSPSNGRTSLDIPFTAKNAFGVEAGSTARCIFESGRMLDAWLY